MEFLCSFTVVKMSSTSSVTPTSFFLTLQPAGLCECRAGLLVQGVAPTGAVPAAPCRRLPPLLQHGVLSLERHQAGKADGRTLVLLLAVSLLPAHRSGVSAVGDSANGTHPGDNVQHAVCCGLLG